MLERGGRTAAADALRDHILQAGGDISASAALNQSAEEIVADYRDLFACGFANSSMLANYLVLLSRLGQSSQMAELVDPQRHVKQVRVLPRAGLSLWSSAAAMLAAKRGEENWQESVKSVRRMHVIRGLEQYDAPVSVLLQEIHDQVARYVDEARRRPSKSLNWVPANYRISAWAVISTGEGFNVPHIHHRGWLSGTLYLAGPDETGPDGYPAGALRVGRPAGMEASAPGWPDLTFAPAPGTLVLMPSYFTHWTLPIGKPSLRAAIAFDVIDRRQ